MSEFTRNGQLTEDGQKVAQYLTATFNEGWNKKTPDALNALPGHVKGWGTNVLLMKSFTAAQWLDEHPSAGEHVLETLTLAAQANESATNAENAAQGVNKITEQLSVLETLVKQQAEELKALKEARDEKKPAKKTDKVKDEDDGEEN